MKRANSHPKVIAISTSQAQAQFERFFVSASLLLLTALLAAQATLLLLP